MTIFSITRYILFNMETDSNAIYVIKDDAERSILELHCSSCVAYYRKQHHSYSDYQIITSHQTP